MEIYRPYNPLYWVLALLLRIVRSDVDNNKTIQSMKGRIDGNMQQREQEYADGHNNAQKQYDDQKLNIKEKSIVNPNAPEYTELLKKADANKGVTDGSSMWLIGDGKK